VDDGVELVREPRVKIVREALSLRLVDDADRSLEPRSVEPAGLEEKALDPGLVEERLPTTGQGGTDALALGRGAPQPDAAVTVPR
jgi:hypothetical protein